MKEPFLVNPHVGIINPRQKGKKAMARRKRSSKAHMAYVRSFRKSAKRRKASPARRKRARKSYRRNPYPMAGAVVNPRRKRRSRRRSHSVSRRRSHSYSRNPRILGIDLPPFEKVAFAAGGFLATPIIEGYAGNYLPASITTNTFGKYAVRIGVVAGLAYLVSRFLGREKGNQVLIGGGVYVAATAANEFFPSLAHIGTSQSMLPPAATQKAYVAANPGVRAYVPASLGMPSAAMLNLESSGAVGGTAVRFKRF